MRVMVLIKADAGSEAGIPPCERLLTEMGKYNEELVMAGVLLAGEGLQPSSAAKRVRLADGQRSVSDGPFAQTGELIAGFWLWQVASVEEAVEWVKRMPDPMPGSAPEVEIRPVLETEESARAIRGDP